MVASLVPHGDIQAGGVASSETSVFKASLLFAELTNLDNPLSLTSPGPYKFISNFFPSTIQPKWRIKRLTGRSWFVTMEYHMKKIARYLRGWMNFFGISENFARYLKSITGMAAGSNVLLETMAISPHPCS